MFFYYCVEVIMLNVYREILFFQIIILEVFFFQSQLFVIFIYYRYFFFVLFSRMCVLNDICVQLWSLVVKRKLVCNIWFYFFYYLNQGIFLVMQLVYSVVVFQNLYFSLIYFGLMGVLCRKVILFEIFVSLKVQYLIVFCIEKFLIILWLCIIVFFCIMLFI